MYIDASIIAKIGGVITVIITLVTLSWKLFKWINHQKEQDEEIKRIEKKCDDRHAQSTAEREEEKRAIQEELTLIIYALQACLQGLHEQGCDGSVSEAINKIDRYINQKAHKA